MKTAFKPADRAEVTRFATLWSWDRGPFRWTGKQSIELWERLRVQPPRSAKPYCYLSNTIKFHDGKHERVFAEIQHYDFNTPSPTLVYCDGFWWEMGTGAVKWRNGAWFYVCTGWKNTRAARMMNTGFPEYRS